MAKKRDEAPKKKNDPELAEGGQGERGKPFSPEEEPEEEETSAPSPGAVGIGIPMSDAEYRRMKKRAALEVDEEEGDDDGTDAAEEDAGPE